MTQCQYFNLNMQLTLESPTCIELGTIEIGGIGGEMVHNTAWRCTMQVCGAQRSPVPTKSVVHIVGLTNPDRRTDKKRCIRAHHA